MSDWWFVMILFSLFMTVRTMCWLIEGRSFWFAVLNGTYFVTAFGLAADAVMQPQATLEGFAANFLSVVIVWFASAGD